MSSLIPWGPLLLRLLLSGALVETREAPTTAAQDSVASLSVYLEALQTSESMTAPFSVMVLIENRTDKEFVIDSVTLELPTALTAVRKYSTKASCLLNSIKPYATVRCMKEIEEVGFRFPSSLLEPHVLFFLPGDYQLRAWVWYRESVPEKPTELEFASTVIRLKPPMSSLLGGGLIGAFLLGLFVAGYQWRAAWLNPEGGGSSLRIIRDVGIHGVTLFGFGSIVAIVVILLLQRLGDLNLPISIEVTDYLGGIVVGLFSMKLGDYLFSRFLGDGTEHTPSPRPQNDD